MKKILLILFVGLMLMSFDSKKHFIRNEMENRIEQDTAEMSFDEVNKFENTLKLIYKSSLTKYEKQEVNKIILDNKEKAKSFASNIALMNYPNLLKPIKVRCSEDKSSKFWFIVVRVCPSQYCFGGELQFIVLKSNCKVIWYYQTS